MYKSTKMEDLRVIIQRSKWRWEEHLARREGDKMVQDNNRMVSNSNEKKKFNI